ncbi:tetratricopeptide repeat-containing sulfotransferase family protein [Alteraurantiacibacter buctensis]|uniref:Tetratricopeptide repeat protein n=1 Tax=Alteraurantiacibacter buctensis TaxID=1503981 RepID=A0A844YZU2_9SPHN|nr:sulfotransferase [Alteraurantiacibacter buctensis]MXO72732.1 tetratricopeptide repeat protein [Alteraurantiacibacter buctensis]
MTDLSDLPALASTLAHDPAAALAGIQRWMAANGARPDALRLAAAAHRALSEPANAQRAEIAAIEASAGVPDLREADAALTRREYSTALELADRHLRSQPDDLKGLTIAAESVMGLGQADRAIPLLEKVLQRAPPYLLARTLLVNALTHVDRLTDAQRLLDPVLARLPADPGFRELAGKIASRKSQFALAVDHYRTLTGLAPDVPEAWIALGDNLRYLGDRQQALAAYRQAIALKPDHGLVWWSIADLAADTLTEGDLAAIAAALDSGPPPDHKANLEFALGIAADKRGNHAAAFSHFHRGNEARRAFDHYDGAALEALVDGHLAKLGALPGRSAPPPGTATPVFIVGMPRSGSTLLERMLGQHSQVEALGELPIISHMVARLRRDDSEQELVDRVAALPHPQRAYLGQFYLARAAEMRHEPDKPLFIDKMHMNWRHLPLILRILPHARVIDIRRDAMDCCWSNYRTMFANGHPAALDQRDIAHFYRQYARFMDELASRYPTAVHRVDYEDLLADPANSLAGLCGYLGIAPEEAMLAFDRSRAPVATASSEQVRQALNTRGVGAWRDYAAWLGPMQEALGPAADKAASPLAR